ncbi:RING-H2 finger protein ATL16-like [Musa acuminata AAA Group]|uniref:RING-H2 finger protein ATL16-like n=1 Tax=Musa acuminata AAA Group TaxID=214697 RepID=UPI0031DBB9CC
MDPQSFHPSLKSRPLPPSPSSLTSFPILAISIVGIVTTSVLLLSYYVFVIKCCLNWHRSDVVSRLSRSRRRRRRAGPFMALSNTAKGLGLDESTIQAIPTFRYREEADSVAECAVCLNGFHDEERIKLLPDCFHVFHIDCIDTWLQANANCPLCRSSITAPIPTDHLMALVPSSDPYRRNDAVVEVRDFGSDLVGSLTTTNTTSPWKTEQRLGHKKGRKLQCISSMGDECIDLREKDEQFCVQRMRRSFSMGSSGDRQLDMELQKILQQNSHLQDVNGEISSSSGRYQRSFFSFGPSSPSAVLPLQIELRSKRNLASLLLEVFY